jgi:SAM-dependent methyltransferase
MLRRAQERVLRYKHAHIEALAVMDAQHLGFPGSSFDAVVAQYVLTAVPHPEATLDEFVRVVRRGGEIILVNHLSATGGIQRAVEDRLARIVQRLGWCLDFDWPRLERWLGQFEMVRLERLAGHRSTHCTNQIEMAPAWVPEPPMSQSAAAGADRQQGVQKEFAKEVRLA